MDKAINIIRNFAPKNLVVSVGADIFEGDPLGKFKVTRKGFHYIGDRIANIRMPTLIIMEGGYNNHELGENIVTFLSSFEQLLV